MSIRRKLLFGSVGLFAFVGALIAVPILSMFVSSLIPGATKDAPGKMESSMEETLKQMNSPASATQENKAEAQQQESKENSTTAKTDESQVETPSPARQEPRVQQAEPVGPAADPAPYYPPAPQGSGPGDFHVDQPYNSPGGSGPGNM